MMKKNGITTLRLFIYLLLGVTAALCFLPFYLMILNATRSSGDILSGISFIPGTYTVKNLLKLLSYERIFLPLFNSAFIALSSIIGSGYISALTAFGFAFYTFRGKRILFGCVISLIIIPGGLAFIGFYNLISTMGLIDTHLALIVPGFANAFAVFFLCQYKKANVPVEMLEVGRIDGAKELALFHRVVLPMVSPALFTLSIFTFIGSWNSYIVPLIVINSPEKRTIPLIIAQGFGYRADMGATYIAITISIIPILVIFILFSRKIVEGISFTGLKG